MGRGLSVIRGFGVEVVAGTLAETVITTPANAANRTALIIRKIAFDLAPPLPPALRPAADGALIIQVVCALSGRQGLADMPRYGNPGCLGRIAWNWTEASQVGDSGNGLSVIGNSDQILDYADGLVISDSTLSVYIQGNAAFAGLTSCGVAIFYELVTLTPELFMAALSVIESL